MFTKFKNRKPRRTRGMTLLEVMLSIVVSTGVIAATFVFFIPWMKLFDTLITNNDYRTSLVSLVDTIEKEAVDQMTIYVDSGACYNFCMVDETGNRTYYYYEQGSTAAYRNLYRKKEAVTNSVSCSGGKVVARNIKVSATSFTNTNSLFSMNIVGVGDSHTTNPFPVYNVVFPVLKERKYLFTEGFECNTLASGWIVNAGAASTWSVSESSTGIGKYLVVDSQSGTGTNTSTIEVPLDLARVSSATLTFNYFNDGTIGVPDSFKAELWDGAVWQTLYSDSTGAMVLSPRSVTADLSSYTLSTSNKVRFSGTLKTSGSHWYVDGIQIYNP